MTRWLIVGLGVCFLAAVWAAYDLSRTLNRALRLPEEQDPPEA